MKKGTLRTVITIGVQLCASLLITMQAQNVRAYKDGSSTDYAHNALTQGVLADADSIEVTGSWTKAYLIDYLRKAIPNDGTCQLQKVDMSAMNFSGDTGEGTYELFRDCKSLKTVIFPSNEQTAVVNLHWAFLNCEALDSIGNMDKILYINNMDSAFKDCRKLKYIVFATTPNTNKVQARHAFEDCKSLISMDLSGFHKLTGSNDMFKGCENLEVVRFADVEQTESNSLANRFDGCVKLHTIENLDKFVNLSAFTEAFKGCKMLDSIALHSLPNTGSTSSMAGTFQDCELLRVVIFPNVTNNVGNAKNAFNGCKALRRIEGFQYLTKLTNLNATFKNCAVLDSVRFGMDPSTINSPNNTASTFDYCNKNCLKYMLCGAKKASNWNYVNSDQKRSYHDSTFIYDIRYGDEPPLTKCDSFTWHGTTYTTSGDYTHTFDGGASNGCDSIASLHLTMVYTQRSDTTATKCDSFAWHGITYTESGIYNDTIVGGAACGCDSIVTLHLTINASVATTDAQTACDTYTWIDGNIYTESNHTATHLLQTIAGCDSLVTLDLTINQTQRSDTIATACDSLVWHGTTYTESGIYNDTIANGAACGCDSIVTLHLTVNYTAYGQETPVVTSNSYTWHGVTYTESGIYNDTIAGGAACGCDSIVTLNLTIFDNFDAGSVVAANEAICMPVNVTSTTLDLPNDVGASGGDEAFAYRWLIKAEWGTDHVLYDTIFDANAHEMYALDVADYEEFSFPLTLTCTREAKDGFICNDYQLSDNQIVYIVNGDTESSQNVYICALSGFPATPYTYIYRHGNVDEKITFAADGEVKHVQYPTSAGCTHDVALKAVLCVVPEVEAENFDFVCGADSEAFINYIIKSGNPDHYDLWFDDAAKAVGFADVNGAVLPAGKVALAIPHDVAAGDYTATIRFADQRPDEGCAGTEYQFTFTVGLDASRYLIQKWNDVVVVNNSGDSQHPSQFVAYQWYRNNAKIAGATLQHYYEEGGLNGIYYVVLTTLDGRTIRSCDFEPQTKPVAAVPQITIYPNPVATGSDFMVALPEEAHLFEVYSAQGMPMLRRENTAMQLSFEANFPAGIYLLRAVTADGRVFSAGLVVK